MGVNASPLFRKPYLQYGHHNLLMSFISINYLTDASVFLYLHSIQADIPDSIQDPPFSRTHPVYRNVLTAVNTYLSGNKLLSSASAQGSI